MDKTPKKRTKFSIIKSSMFMLGAAIGLIFILTPNGSKEKAIDKGTKVPYSQITASIEDHKITEAWLYSGQNLIIADVPGKANIYSFYPLGNDDVVAEALTKANIKTTVVPLKGRNWLLGLLGAMLPILLLIGFLVFLGKRGPAVMMGQLKKKNNPVEVPTTRFSDVAGADEALEDLREIVDFLHKPEKYTATGAKVPRGFLLVGPPGTGKTLLARAVAGEAGVPFYAIAGADFVEMFVGLGASRVRDLFKEVREQEKAIIFIDEIDAVGKARGKNMMTGSNDERENTLNALLVELDGFARHDGIIILAATNRPDVLDPALLRPGRFDRTIVVPIPDRVGREKIMELYARNRPFAPNIDWKTLAKRIPGMTGAQIEQLLNEAALEAARKGSTTIEKEHVESSLATTMLGRERRSAVISERDHRIIAWHEAGHAVAALLLVNADDPVQISIIPRGSTGGATWMSGNEHDLMTKSQALARLIVGLSGRAAEEILLAGDFTQGAHGDLAEATALATAMVARYGMGSRLVTSLDNQLMFDGPVNEAIIIEVSTLISTALQQATELLNNNKELLANVAHDLLDKETLNLEDMHILQKQHATFDPNTSDKLQISEPCCCKDPCDQIQNKSK
jgi:cell division protease FtsH